MSLDLEHVQTIVIKIGSGVLARNGGFNRKALQRLAGEVTQLRRGGRQVIVVSSGAIALGMKPLGLRSMPRDIVNKQAAAAVGQQMLMNAWTDALSKARLTVAQVLLTADDLDHRTRYLNARHTLQALLNRGVIPIVNENDSVSCDEIKMGDNDHLSALVTTLVSANLLILLTNVAGLCRGGLGGEIIPVVAAHDDVQAHIRQAKSATGVGGMQTKVDAARLVNDAGIPAIVTSGNRSGALAEILAGKNPGTFFVPKKSTLDPRRRWIATATRPRGTLVVDAGARRAIVERHASLLPSGVVAVEGRFEAGSVVRVRDEEGDYFARGLASYAADEIQRVRGKKGRELPAILGYRYLDEIIHRNDLVVETQRSGRGKEKTTPE